MGFNNEGALTAQQRLATSRLLSVPLGISLGKNKDTPMELAAKDYQTVLRALHDYGDYFVINVSSPNTVGLRSLQGKEQLSEIVETLTLELRLLASCQRCQPKPLLVKIAPDLEWSALDELLEVVMQYDVSGVIATNTTVNRPNLSTEINEVGGLSGKPLHSRSLEVVRYVRQHTNKKLPIIGVGGIMNPESAYAMLKAGANLLQVYTGFVYGGPLFVRSINRGLLRLMEQDGIMTVEELRRFWPD